LYCLLERGRSRCARTDDANQWCLITGCIWVLRCVSALLFLRCGFSSFAAAQSLLRTCVEPVVVYGLLRKLLYISELANNGPTTYISFFEKAVIKQNCAIWKECHHQATNQSKKREPERARARQRPRRGAVLANRRRAARLCIRSQIPNRNRARFHTRATHRWNPWNRRRCRRALRLHHARMGALSH